jgi:hypothetical protein
LQERLVRHRRSFAGHWHGGGWRRGAVHWRQRDSGRCGRLFAGTWRRRSGRDRNSDASRRSGSLSRPVLHRSARRGHRRSGGRRAARRRRGFGRRLVRRARACAGQAEVLQLARADRVRGGRIGRRRDGRGLGECGRRRDAQCRRRNNPDHAQTRPHPLPLCA